MEKCVKIDPLIIYNLINNSWEINPYKDYTFIKDTIISSDQEDGGADHELIIQRISDSKYFKILYTDWDIDNTDYDEENDILGERIDLTDEMQEVFPVEKTIIVYE